LKTLWVTDRAAIGDERFSEMLRTLGGAPELSVEIREKASPDRETLAWTRRAVAILGARTPLSVNRRFDIALAGGARGVHLPADAVPAAAVRPLVPRGFRIGVSAHSVSEATAALEEGADVVVIGPVFSTPSKTAFGPPLGPERLEALPKLSTHAADVFAIGGITDERLDELAGLRDRISGVAAIRLFQTAADPRAVVERIAAR
jgi:thiamine-phosphate pyrophosphorylase